MSLDAELNMASPEKSRRIGVEASKTIERKTESGFVAKYLSGNAILDIGYRGYIEDVQPVVPQAIGIELDYPGYDGRRLPFDDQTQDAVFASHCLEHIEDYRNALSDWHRVLKIGGFMIIAVPHQYLYERRTRLPSRWNEDHKRFYTPASLMGEIEQALEPNTYRLRHLADNDEWYDYPVPLETHPGGCYEIELVIERISPPAWKLEVPPQAMAATVPVPDSMTARSPHPIPAVSICADPQPEAALPRDSAGREAAAQPGSIAGKILAGYRKLRYFPRDTIALLGDAIALLSGISAELSKHSQKPNSLTPEILASWRDMQADVSSLLTREFARFADTNARIGEAARRIESLEQRLVSIWTEAAEQSPAMAKLFGGGMKTLVARLDEQAARIDNLSIAVSEQARMLPSWPWTPEAAREVRSILALLSPVAARDVAKIRVGREFDGGYVMLDDFTGVEAALSLGIADDVSWDTSVAERGVRVLQFDPSIEASPAPNNRFQFESLRVAPNDGEGEISLDTIVRTRVGAGDASLLLKVDIESAEWDVLQAAGADTLARFKQIICEFHDLDRLVEEGFAQRAKAVFGKLAQTHFVFHVHGNNCGSFSNCANVVVPQTLEVSLARRADYDIDRSAALFPTGLDYPNQPGRADLFLGSFLF